MSRKPSTPTIRASAPLCPSPPADPLSACNVCGQPAEQLDAWRTHDEHDRPIAGVDALVFLGSDHAACRTKLNAHPRLFAEVTGVPGHFPRLCGPCAYRRDTSCSHPDLKANGGAGLNVSLDNAWAAGLICIRPASARPVHHAVECVGRVDSGGGK